MRFIFGLILIIGIIWLLIFLGTLVGLLGLMAIRIAIMFGIPILIVGGIYKMIKK